MNRARILALSVLVLSLAGQARAQYGYPYPARPAAVPITPNGVPLPPPYAPPGMAVYGPLETLQGSPITSMPMQAAPSAMSAQTAARGPVQGTTVSQSKLVATPGASPVMPTMQAAPEPNAFSDSPPNPDSGGRRRLLGRLRGW